MEIDVSIPRDLSVLPLARIEDLVGNVEPMKKALRVCRSGGRLRMALYGPSGSGKSTTINYVCELAHCDKPNGNVPCRQCAGCSRFKTGHRETGFFAYHLNWDNPLHYSPINCRNITPTKLHDQLEHLRFSEGRRLIHLEEGKHLIRLGCDVSLTDIMDDPDFESCIWFMTAVNEIGLDGQFLRRWGIRTVTTPPNEGDVACLIAKRCNQLKIAVDHPNTLLLLAKKAWCVVGLATCPLALALVEDPPMLTRKMVEEYPFPVQNPWKEKFLAN